MRRPTFSGPGWTAWTRTSDVFQLGQVGFSFKGKRGHADIYPVQGSRDTLSCWEGKVWAPGDREQVIATFRADGPEQVAREVEGVAR